MSLSGETKMPLSRPKIAPQPELPSSFNSSAIAELTGRTFTIAFFISLLGVALVGHRRRILAAIEELSEVAPGSAESRTPARQARALSRRRLPPPARTNVASSRS